MKSWLVDTNQEAPPPSTSGSGPTMHSNLRMLPMALLFLCQRHNRRRIGRICIHSLRSRDNHRIRGSHRIHHIRGSHRIRGLAARRQGSFRCRIRCRRDGRWRG
jgi:hypothetical protein